MVVASKIENVLAPKNQDVYGEHYVASDEGLEDTLADQPDCMRRRVVGNR